MRHAALFAVALSACGTSHDAPNGPQPDLLAAARSGYACEGRGAGSPSCAQLDRFAHAHTPAALTTGRTYLGGTTGPGGDVIVEVAMIAAGSPRIGQWFDYPVFPPLDARIAEVHARSADPRPLDVHDDLEFAGNVTYELRLDGYAFTQHATALTPDPAHDVLAGSRENYGPILLRELDGHLLYIASLPLGTYIGELSPERDFTSDRHCLASIPGAPNLADPCSLDIWAGRQLGQ